MHSQYILPYSLPIKMFSSNLIRKVSLKDIVRISLVSVLPLMLPLFGIRFLKTSVHHPLLALLERSSKLISMQRHIFLSSFSYGFSVVPTCLCPWTLNLHIAIVLLHLRVHYSVEIKRYKSLIRTRLPVTVQQTYFHFVSYVNISLCKRRYYNCTCPIVVQFLIMFK